MSHLVHRWMIMYVTVQYQKKNPKSLGVYFQKMNHGSEQWLWNRAIEEMYMVVYFLKCLICSVSSQQKIEK